MPTKRRRFLWAAWWSGPPVADPFRKPDASSGGARTREEAQAAAEAVAGQRLVEIDGRWAGAWVRVLRGDPPWPKAREDRAEAPKEPANKGSRAWALALLGVGAEAGEGEIKRAFRAAALRTHPDHGGEETAFIEVKRALDVALAAAGGAKKKRRRR